MNIVAADIETNGLLLDASEIHCGVTHDITNGIRKEWTDAEDLYEYLCTFDRLVMHNGRMFDAPVLERLAGGSDPSRVLPPVLDTLLLSRLLWPDKGNTPAGGHSLEKWGEFAGITKAHADIEDWSVYTPEMMERCHTDVDITAWLYKYLLPKCKGWGESIQLEHTVASIITKQIQNGFPIDMEKVDRLEFTLNSERLGLMDELSGIPPWVEEMKTPAYYYHPDNPHVKFEKKNRAPKSIQKYLVAGPNRTKETLFNPGSNDHIARLFIEKYKWKPTQFTEKTGKPIINEKILESLDYPEAQTISRVKLIDKRLSQIAQWRQYERDGRIHGDVITNGCVSGRMSHSKPNMAQVPASKKPYGKECRACFTSRKGWVLVGADASGLEARMLAAYMSKWDGGKFGEEIIAEDIHTVNQRLASLDSRDQAKTLYYAFMYGGGDTKLGKIVNGGRSEGAALKRRFFAAAPAIENLMKWVQSQVKNKKELIGLDGRHYPIRSDHMALNTLLQGAGAVVMKKALCIFFEEAERVFGPHGKYWALCGNIHDEKQMECIPLICTGLGQMFVDSIKKAGTHFNLGCPLDGEYKCGTSWDHTH